MSAMHPFKSSPPPSLIADDLTGACDAGIALQSNQLSVRVILQPNASVPSNAACILSTDSRNDSPSLAYRKTRDAVRQLSATHRSIAFKKMDSTLHGHPGAEISALLDSGVARTAWICPAFPAMGRRLLRGELLLGPQRNSIGRNLLPLLASETARIVRPVSIPDLRGSPQSLRLTLQRATAAGTSLFVFDAEEESDIDQIAHIYQNSLPAQKPLLCGSSGLARLLPQCLSLPSELNAQFPETPPSPPTLPPSSSRPSIYLLGTRSRTTHRQVETLVALRGARTAYLSTENPPNLSLWLKSPAPIVLTVDLGSPNLADLAHVLQPTTDTPPAAWILSGGDTARWLTQLLAVEQMELLGEIVRGIPHGRFLGGPASGQRFVTKAGGFGDDFALVACEDFLHATATLNPAS